MYSWRAPGAAPSVSSKCTGEWRLTIRYQEMSHNNCGREWPALFCLLLCTRPAAESRTSLSPSTDPASDLALTLTSSPPHSGLTWFCQFISHWPPCISGPAERTEMIGLKIQNLRTCLVVQWLRLHLRAGGAGSNPSWEGKIPHASWPKSKV